MRLLIGRASEIWRAWGSPFGTSSPCLPSTRPRCDHHASPRFAWRWRGPVRCHPWPWCWSCQPDGTAAGARVGHADVEVAVGRLGSHAHLAGVGELDGVADEVEEHLADALLVAKPDGQGLRHLGLEGELLVLREG